MHTLTALALGLTLLATPAGADRGRPLQQVEQFLAATTRGDVAAAVEMLDEGATYQGMLICAPAPCVGRDEIAAALARESEDETAHELWPQLTEETATTAAASGEMRSRSLAPARLVYTLRATVGPGGIADLRLWPDERDPQTRHTVESLAAVQRLLDEARAVGIEGPVTFGGAPAP